MILIAYGTRPERIKVTPLIAEMKKGEIPVSVLHVGQHPSRYESDYYIPVTTNANRLDSIMASVFFAFSNIFYESDITDVIVQGDTSTALAVAMSANHNGMRVIHLEAGLRTYDNENPWPEEQNRRQISAIATTHLCPTSENARNLVDENVLGGIFITGNTAIDNLPTYPQRYNNTVLVTMHRRENLSIMDEWFKAINQLAEENPYLNFILPMHPNPDVQKHKHLLESVAVTPPQGHETLLTVLSACRLIITDSGGIQEEASFYNKKCLVCRTVTERPETVGLSSFLIHSPGGLSDVFNEHIDDYAIDHECPYGDGGASGRIVKILKQIDEK